MAAIGTVTLRIVRDIANADITVTYSLVGSAFDVASGQPYTEVCRLIGDDTGITPPEDNIDDPIPNGVLSSNAVVFPNTTPISRVRTKTLPLANLNEDVGTDEIRAVVQLRPILPSATTRESNQVTGSF